MEKNEIFWEKVKELFTKPRTYIILLVISLLIPLGINWLYKLGDKCSSPFLTKWNAGDVLSFYGSYLSFLGTVVLGAVTVYQTRKAHKQTEHANELTEKANDLAEQMQKLEEIKYVSMISLDNFKLLKKMKHYTDYYDSDFGRTAMIYFPSQKTEKEYYCFNLVLKNDSSFPLTEIDISLKWFYENEEGNPIENDILESENCNAHFCIGAHDSQAVRIVIPCSYFFEYDKNASIHLNYVNVLGYITSARFLVKDIDNEEPIDTYSYQIKKINSIKTKEK